MPVEGPESPLFALEVYVTAVLILRLIVFNVIVILCV